MALIKQLDGGRGSILYLQPQQKFFQTHTWCGLCIPTYTYMYMQLYVAICSSIQ